jgi:ubiquinone/menaquinone biosynthesis C-methylase UbiE
MTVDGDAEFTGKYESSGRIGSALLNAFYNDARELLEPNLRAGDSVLEVGCGAGFSTARLLEWMCPRVRFIGSDVGETLLAKASARNLETPFLRQSVYELAMPDKSIDILVMMEVLEHLDDPGRALAELRRVARRHVLISTPREPLWRALNFCRGKYWRDLGNTPGHIQHWSSRGLRRQVGGHFQVQDMRQPIPWTILLLTPRP